MHRPGWKYLTFRRAPQDLSNPLPTTPHRIRKTKGSSRIGEMTPSFCQS